MAVGGVNVLALRMGHQANGPCMHAKVFGGGWDSHECGRDDAGCGQKGLWRNRTRVTGQRRGW